MAKHGTQEPDVNFGGDPRLYSTIPENIRAITETMLGILMAMHDCARHQHATAPHPTSVYPVTLLINAETGDIVAGEPNALVISIPLVFAGFDNKNVPRFEHPDQRIKRTDAAKLAATSVSTLKRAEGNGSDQLHPIKVSARDVSYSLAQFRDWMLRRDHAKAEREP